MLEPRRVQSREYFLRGAAYASLWRSGGCRAGGGCRRPSVRLGTERRRPHGAPWGVMCPGRVNARASSHGRRRCARPRGVRRCTRLADPPSRHPSALPMSTPQRGARAGGVRAAADCTAPLSRIGTCSPIQGFAARSIRQVVHVMERNRLWRRQREARRRAVQTTDRFRVSPTPRATRVDIGQRRLSQPVNICP